MVPSLSGNQAHVESFEDSHSFYVVSTASERVGAEVFAVSGDDDIRRCIRLLGEFADTHVRNRTTAEACERAIDRELARSGDAPTVAVPDEDAPRCVHCGSTSTYFRLSDGDVACNNCSGIRPRDGGGR